MKRSELHVIGAYTNINRYKVRPRLAREWCDHLLDSGASVTFIEHTIGDRPFEFHHEEMRHVRLIQIRGVPEHEVWLQHALYNRAIAELPSHAQYICWQDTDVKHLRTDWVDETLHMLQRHRIGQTWTNSLDIDPYGNIAPNEWGNATDRSFCAAFIAGEVNELPNYYGTSIYAPKLSKALLDTKKTRDFRCHTGYSWAIRRDALTGLGRLVDWLIAGSGDYHMALGFSGHLRHMVQNALHNKQDERYSPAYFRKLLEFATRCDEHIRQDIGVVAGTLIHDWHGSKRNRFYGAREAILTEAGLNPDTDITYDIHGLPMLSGNKPWLRDGLRRYNGMRNEDSIDV